MRGESIQSSEPPVLIRRQDGAGAGNGTLVTGTATAQAFEPRYIRLDPNDNVAIVVNDLGLPARTRFACGLELRNFVPQGHKVALSDIAEGAVIRRYNEVIGTAAKPILAGEWVDEARIQMPTPPDLDKLELATAVPAPQQPLEGYTFEGFRNPDGSVGTKNVLAISTSVQCVAGTLAFAIKRIKAELLPRYPNVDDVVGLTHNYGCGVAISAPLAIVPIRTLQNLALNPNSAARSWWSASAARNWCPSGCCLRRPAAASCACRMRRSTVSAPSSRPSWRWRMRAWPRSTGAAAKPARLPTS